MKRQALLIARWMHVGFIHGVMSTDNTALSGETIDFGPCAFVDSYDPATTFSAIDEFGRYAYGNQPTIAQSNLARFAETLLPLLDPNTERAVSPWRMMALVCLLRGRRTRIVGAIWDTNPASRGSGSRPFRSYQGRAWCSKASILNPASNAGIEPPRPKISQ